MSDFGSKYITFPTQDPTGTGPGFQPIKQQTVVESVEGMSLNVLNVAMPIIQRVIDLNIVTLQDLEFGLMSKLNGELTMTQAIRFIDNDLNGRPCYNYYSVRESRNQKLDIGLKFDNNRSSISELYIGYKNARDQYNRFRLLFVEKLHNSNDIEAFRISHPGLFVANRQFNATISNEQIERFYYQFQQELQDPEQKGLHVETRRVYMNIGDYNFSNKDYTVFAHNAIMHERNRPVPKHQQSIYPHGADSKRES